MAWSRDGWRGDKGVLQKWKTAGRELGTGKGIGERP